MKSLIAYYTRDGTNRRVAEELQERLGCDIEEIVDLKKRQGWWAYIWNGRDAMKGKLTKIKPTRKVDAYDVVVLCGPTWAWKMTPAMRTYIVQHADEIKGYCVVSVSGSGDPRIIEDYAAVLKRKPRAQLVLKQKHVLEGKHHDVLEEFAEKLE